MLLMQNLMRFKTEMIKRMTMNFHAKIEQNRLVRHSSIKNAKGNFASGSYPE